VLGLMNSCAAISWLVAPSAATRGGEVVHLTPIEFKLLTVLTQNRGRLLTTTRC
jgi:DNA-binding response OmpR family regulator